MTARLGFVLESAAALPPDDFVAIVKETEARGYHTAWLGEVAGYDALVMSTVVVTHTERLRVATGVLPVQTRTPVVLGMASGREGPGPLVTYLVGQMGGQVRLPVTLVPGGLSEAEIDAVS